MNAMWYKGRVKDDEREFERNHGKSEFPLLVRVAARKAGRKESKCNAAFLALLAAYRSTGGRS